VLTSSLHRKCWCLQESLIGDVGANKKNSKQNNKQTNKNKAVTNNQIRAKSRWFGFKITQQINNKCLRNGIKHESEAGENPFLSPALLRKQGAHDKMAKLG